jgi:hypothetical protein
LRHGNTRGRFLITRRLSAAAVAFGMVLQGVPALAAGTAQQQPLALPSPILFVTQVPIPGDFTAIASVFGNQLTGMQSVGRGGDLYIRYPDGALKNLTALAGYGVPSGFQGPTSIAVREPSVDWTGTKALFSMVIGAPPEQYVYVTTFWQLYEVTGLGEGETPVITKVPNQPENFNNVSPIYGTDGRIIFTTDRPRNGQPQLYPQLDEYEEAATVTGVWSLDPGTGDLKILDHAPSGDFSPIIDSFGRVMFTRWDHLQRDQQADADAIDGGTYGTFNWTDESPTSVPTSDRTEVFPEPRAERVDLLAGTNLEGHSFNHFFPWMMREDGTQLETLNHVGRHEFHGYFDKSITDDPNVVEFIAETSGRANPNPIENLLQIAEFPTSLGSYTGVDAPEFYTHAAGQIVSLTAPPSLPADQIIVNYVTDPATRGFVQDGDPIPPGDSGHYREPLPLSDGTELAVHTPETHADYNLGTRELPVSRYDFRIKSLVPGSGGYLEAGATLTPGIQKTLWYWDPDVRVDYVNVTMWELNPVEVRARPVPVAPAAALPAPEQLIFDQEQVNPAEFQADMRARGLAAVVSRNVTTRDAADRQQEFNLRVPGGAQTLGAAGKIYDIASMQFFQADQIRGLGGPQTPGDGRRVLAQVMHDPAVVNPPNPGGPPASVKLGLDGSMAAFVPAERAMSWHLTAPDAVNTSIVKERYWLTFQPGEIRTCTSCHGLNSHDQANEGTPTNPPEALRALLQFWKGLVNHSSISAHDVAVIEGTGAGPQAVFNVTLDQPAVDTVTVAYATANGTATAPSDYTAESGTLSFAPGVTLQTVSVPIVPDNLIETDETFFLNLSSSTNADIAQAQGLAIISDDDAPSLSQDELVHGSTQRRALGSAPGGPTDRDYFRLAQAPGASYEVVADSLSGSLSPLVLERLAADNATVLQSVSSPSHGAASLRWVNPEAEVTNQHVSVRSTGCGAACTATDTYRLRAYETTGFISRFNNSVSQITALILQNTGSDPVSGTLIFQGASGASLASQPFSIAARGTYVLNTASVAGADHASGSVRVAHDGAYGIVTGKGVSIEPATGFTFDTEMVRRPR